MHLLLYNLETKPLITSHNVYFDEEFRFVERTTGADGAPAWLISSSTPTRPPSSRSSRTPTATRSRTLPPSPGTSLGQWELLPSVKQWESVGRWEKNSGSSHSTHATPPTTTASFTVAQLVASNSDIYVKPNSKRPGTASGDRFAKYQSARSVSEYLKLGGTKSDLAQDLKKGIATAKVKVFDDDDDAIPGPVDARDPDDDDDDIPSKKQEDKGDTSENVQPVQFIDATTDETKDDGAVDATKGETTTTPMSPSATSRSTYQR